MTARWFVQVSPADADELKERYCVEAPQWQQALQSARKLRGDKGPLSRFSIELLDSGYRAVDPTARLHYRISPAPLDAPLTAGGPAAATNGKAHTAAADDVAGPQPTREETAKPAGQEAAKPAGQAAAKPAGQAAAKPAGQEAAKPAGQEAAKPAGQEAAKPAGPNRPSAFPKPAVSAAAHTSTTQRRSVIPRPKTSSPPRPTQSAAPAAEPPAPAVKSQSPPPGLQHVPADPRAVLMTRRAEEPTEKVPIVYREYAFSVAEGLPAVELEAILRELHRQTKRDLAKRPDGKFVQIALFDHEFEGRPKRAPVALLAWKDWRGDAVLKIHGEPVMSVRPSEMAEPPPSLSPRAEQAGVDPSGVGPAPAQPAGPPAPVVSADVPRVSGAPRAAIGPGADAGAGITSEKGTAGGVVPSAEPSAEVGAPVPAEAAVASPAADVPAGGAPAGGAVGSATEVETAAPVAAVSPAEAAVSPAEAAVDAPAAAPGSGPALEVEAPQASAAADGGVGAEGKGAGSAGAAPVAADAATASAQGAPVGSFPPVTQEDPAPAPEPAGLRSVPAPDPQGEPVAVPPGDAGPAAPNAQGAAVASEAAAGPAQAVQPVAARRRRGEDLIGELFDRMHDLHFVRDVAGGAQFVLAVLNDVLPCDGVLVHVFDINTRHFVVVRAKGPQQDQLLLHRTSDNEPLFREAFRRRRSVAVDAGNNGAGQAERWTALGVEVGAALCGPVQHGGRYLGVIELAIQPAADPFSESEINALDYICSQFADFVANRPIVLDDDVVIP